MAAVADTTTVRRVRRRITPGRAVAWAVMAAIVLMTMLPFYWILRTALSSNDALAAHPGDAILAGQLLGRYDEVTRAFSR